MKRLNKAGIPLIIGILVIAPLEAVHVLLWVLMHIFEIVEFSLDEIIHLIFHTSRHTTQVIVFYLMLVMLIASVYYLGLKARRFLPAIWRKTRETKYAPVFSWLGRKPILQRQKIR